MIVADGLSKKYDDFLAVDGVSFTVQAGQIMVLLGPNGAGKTTTVRMLSSVLKPTHGQARIAGYDAATQPEQVRARVGVLTEQHGLYGRMDSLEYLDFFGRLYGMTPQAITRRANDLLEQFGLMEARKKRLSEYSKGMRQKLALTRTLLHNPPVLLLDEPTSAMDPESTRSVRNVIAQMRSHDRAIVMCTHNLNEAQELGDQAAIIRRGKIIYHGSIRSFLSEALGPARMEVRLSEPAPREIGPLPEGVRLAERGEYWLRFQMDRPEHDNPALLCILLERGLKVMAFQPVERNLEEAYFETLARENERFGHG